MLIKKNVLTIFLVLICTGAASSKSSLDIPVDLCSEGRAPIFKEKDNSITFTSMYELLFFPEKNLEKFVWLKGYLSTEYEDSRLYLNKDDYDYWRVENSLRVLYDKDNLSLEPNKKGIHHFQGKPVIIGGFFSKSGLEFVRSVKELKPVKR